MKARIIHPPNRQKPNIQNPLTRSANLGQVSYNMPPVSNFAQFTITSDKIMRFLGFALGGIHGAFRNKYDDPLFGLWWAIVGAALPYHVIGLAIAQGFAKPDKGDYYYEEFEIW